MSRNKINVCVAIIAIFAGILLGLYYRSILDFIFVHRTVLEIVGAAVTVFIGYLFGTVKSFREEKQKAYGEILPPIVRMGYNPSPDDEKEFNKALVKLWLYGSRKVCYKIEDALSIMHTSQNLDIVNKVTNSLQKAVVEMRSDIQVFPWQRLDPKDVNHLYTRIVCKDKDT